MFRYRRRTSRVRRRRSNPSALDLVHLTDLIGFNFVDFDQINAPSTSTRRNASKKRKNKDNTKSTSKPIANPTDIINLEDSEDETSIPNSFEESVQGRVNNFFQSGHLISDDEDEPILLDDKRDTKTAGTSSKPTQSYTCDENDIIVEDDPNKISSLQDIEYYCKETEDMLKNANAILEKFTNTQTNTSDEMKKDVESEKKVEEKTQEKKIGDCPVCLEDMSTKQVMSTKCGHLFCKPCLEKIATTIKKCPTCRKVVNKKNIILIYI